jgi:hypothetical protein
MSTFQTLIALFDAQPIRASFLLFFILLFTAAACIISVHALRLMKKGPKEWAWKCEPLIAFATGIGCHVVSWGLFCVYCAELIPNFRPF